MHAGLYKPERLNYVDPMMTPFDGTMSLTLKGTREKPITIKAAGDGEVIFDGAGNHRLFDVMASRHHIFDGLTIRNTDVAIFGGQKEVLGAVGLTVKNCRFEQVGFGVWTEYAGSSDFYIADNLFLGRDDRFRLIGWTGPSWASAGPYGSHLLTSYYAIKVYGPGHVIAHNAIAYFHDGIGISTYGTPPQDPDQRASSIDICNNDLHLLNDDFVETDGGVHNVRVMNNRGVNAAQGGYSSQPVFGEPVYFIGNILYHVPSGVAFKFSAKPAGLFVYHNTIIGEQVLREPSSNVHFRNNLFLGRDTPGRGIMTWANATDAFSSDYNGFRSNKGVTEQYSWLAPKTGQQLYEPKRDDWKSFATLADFRAATMQETHGIEVDFGDFEGLAPPDPANRHAVYHAVDLNFRLKPASKAVDAGVLIPTVNDGFTGPRRTLARWKSESLSRGTGQGGSKGSRFTGNGRAHVAAECKPRKRRDPSAIRLSFPYLGRAAIGRRVGRTMLGIVRPTDRHGLAGGPRRDQSRLDPPYGMLPRSPQPEIPHGAEIVRTRTL